MSRARQNWRTFGYWALTLNAALGFPTLVCLTLLRATESLTVLAGAYATVLTTWIGAAAVRQWGKNTGSEGVTPKGTSYGKNR